MATAPAPDYDAIFAAMPDEEVMRLHRSLRIETERKLAAELRALDPMERKRRFVEMEVDAELKERLRVRWESVWARPDQLPPPGKWRTWMAQAGRGWGKTEAGAQWVRQRVRDGARSIALVAETQKDLEEVMVARLINIYPSNQAPSVRYKPVRLTWPNGAIALGYNGTEPDQLRGPEFDTAWVDELAKYDRARALWDMLQFTMRMDDPRIFVTTTPRPIPIIKEIIANRSTVVVRGTTMDNEANLDPDFLDEILTKYEGTRLGRQEINAEILDDVPGALWTRENIDRNRKGHDDIPDMARIVVAVDPSGTKGEADEEANDVGIVVVGLGMDGRGYVLADRTCNLSPEGWGRQAVDAYYEFDADRIVAETNFGGAMVGSIIKSIDKTVPFSEVRASRGKVARAEPIAAFYEQNRVSHVGPLSALEDQMMLMTGAGYAGDGSPDRVDATVWGLTDLMINTTQVFRTAIPEFTVAPFVVPKFWPRAYAMKVEGDRTVALWGAYDSSQRILYVTTEHVRVGAEPSVNVAAIRTRGEWIPGVIDSDETKLESRRELAQFYAALGLELMLADQATEAGVNDVSGMISTARLKVFSTCQGFFKAYRAYRRDEGGDLLGDGLMDCLRILARPSTIMQMREPPNYVMVRQTVGPQVGHHRGDTKMGY